MKTKIVLPLTGLSLLIAVSFSSMAFGLEYSPQAHSIQCRAGSGSPCVIMLPVNDVDESISNLACTVSGSAHGIVAYQYPDIYPTNSHWVVFTATNGFTGNDSFTFRASDGVQTSGVATCTVVVVANTAPTAGTTLSEAAGTCHDKIELKVSDAETAKEYLDCSIISPPAHGAVSYQYAAQVPTNSYQLIYQASNGFTGVDSFTFQANDGVYTSVVATCTVYVVSNTPPNANPGGGVAAIGTATKVWLNGWDDHTDWDELEFLVVSNPVHGNVWYQYPDEYPSRSDNIIYGVTNTYIGEDYFSFVVTDGAMTSSVETMTMTIQTNNPPNADGSSNKLTAGAAMLDLYMNCWDTETAQELLDCTIVGQPTNGVMSYKYPAQAPTNSTEMIYTLTNLVYGTDVMTYQVSDGDMVSGIATCVVTLVTNSAPISNDRSSSVVQGGDITVYLSGSDPDTYYGLLYTIVDPPAHGYVSYANPEQFPDSSQTVIFHADAAYSGSDSFTYKVNDGELDSNISTITITINGNTAPTATAMTLEATAGMVESVYLNVSDAETSVSLLECIITDPPDHGELSYQYPDQYPQSSRYMEYLPDDGYTGPDSFSFRAGDGSLMSSIATGTITVVSNTPPVANDMSETGVEDTQLSIVLDVSDVDTSTYQLECVVVDQPTNGTVTYRYPGSYPNSSYQMYYMPSNGFSGTDCFTFTASDGMLTSRIATCSVTIQTNTPPEAFTLKASTLINTNVLFSAEYEDPDPGQTFTAVVVSAASSGTVTVSGTTFTYTPDTDFSGVDSFTYKVNDGKDDSNVAEAQVQVRAPSDRAGNLVIVVVRDTLLPEISNEVERLQGDLVNEGYTTQLKTFSSAASVSNVWAYLQTEYRSTNQWLNGAILIGGLPIPSLAGGHETDLVYWNMNFYQIEGSVSDFNIWVSRIYSSGTTYGNEITLIKRALEVNHDYRSGKSRIPHDVYYYHAWSSYAAGDLYGAHFTNIWPHVEHTNEIGADHQANAQFFPARNLREGGADALVGGGELFQETSHGNKTSYMNGRFNMTDLHRFGSQQRFIMGESCTSGDYGGIVNHHILTRIGGTIFAVGGSEINYVGDFQLGESSSTEAAVRKRLAQGDSWGNALMSKYPFSARNRTVYYGDLSTGVMASDSNNLPVITSISVDNNNPGVGESVTFTIEVSDPDAGNTDSPYYDFDHQIDWWPVGYNNGRNDPAYTTNDNLTTWTNFTYTYTSNGSFTVRVEVMDEWQAKAWEEISVIANDPAVAVDDYVVVEAAHAVTIAVLTNDYDVNGDSFTIDSFTQGDNGTVVHEEQTLVYTATNLSWAGTDTFTYTIEDALSGSSTATVTVDVVTDVAGPEPLHVSNYGNMTRLVLVFDEPVAAGSGLNGAENAANYSMNNGAGIAAAYLQQDELTVYLSVTGLYEYVDYVLTLNNIHDRATVPNVIETNTQIAFTYTFVIAEDDFESGDGEGGSGWRQDWAIWIDGSVGSGTYPYEGSYHLILRRDADATREVDMTGITGAVLRFWWKAYSLDSVSETATVMINDGSWRTLLDVHDGEDDNVYHYTNFSLNAYNMISNFTFRAVVDGDSTADYFFLDDIIIEATGSGEPMDGDGDGMADNWERIQWGSTNVSSGAGDQDNDGSCDCDEYRAGTDPNSASSCLAIESTHEQLGTNLVMTWQSIAGKQYAITSFTSLFNSVDTILQQDINATPPANTYTSQLEQIGRCFYRIKLQE